MTGGVAGAQLTFAAPYADLREDRNAMSGGDASSVYHFTLCSVTEYNIWLSIKSFR